MVGTESSVWRIKGGEKGQGIAKKAKGRLRRKVKGGMKIREEKRRKRGSN
jgi:hypothetical protein